MTLLNANSGCLPASHGFARGENMRTQEGMVHKENAMDRVQS